ncbi:MAG: hypothetical protein H6667_01035 [Ardenticatenaceae bacterium]|nr:hypothetical protein [Ardenticatenaceae bacterium]
MDDVRYEMRPGLNQTELRAIIPDYDALIVPVMTQVTAELLASALSLKLLGEPGLASIILTSKRRQCAASS